MKLTILGSGNFLPDTNRNCSSYLIETNNENIIMDCGRGTISSLINLKKDAHSITRIFISHRHTDHFTEIAPILGLLFESPKKPKFKDEKLYVYGPKGTAKAILQLMKAFAIYNQTNLNKIIIHELKDKETIKFDNLSIQAFQVEHDNNSKCLAYRISSNNKIIAYSGDSTDCTGLRKACKNADIALMESTLPPEEKHPSHLDGILVGKIASEEKVKEIIIVHVDKDYLNRVESDIKSNFPGKIVLGKDLMQIEID